jgi:GrpB-like predicted nucleotidyltransferase (UPF0157 family)
MNNGHKILLSGCEVDRIDRIPDRMHGFEVTPSRLRVYAADRLSAPIVDTPVQWEWRYVFRAFGQEFVAGDLVAADLAPGPRLENLDEGPYRFCFSENTYADYGSDGYREDEILLADPDSAWAEKFAELKKWILGRLGPELALRIEHYGSTSIPGIPAKPVIDILVEIPTFEVLRSDIVPRMCSPDCAYSFFMGHGVFTKRTAYDGERIAHIHMAPRDHDVWRELGFRDYLRSHPDVAMEYAELKRRLASKYREDRNHYTMGKEAFVERVASLVRAEGSSTIGIA